MEVGCDAKVLERQARTPVRAHQGFHEDEGVKGDEAEERAARTVNKQRAEHGETKASKKR
jgi:hypothetical protein